MSDNNYLLHFDKSVKVEPGFIRLVPGLFISQVINDHLEAHYKYVREWLESGDGLAGFVNGADGVMCPQEFTIRIGGQLVDFVLCSVTTKIEDQGAVSYWKTHACTRADIEPGSEKGESR